MCLGDTFARNPKRPNPIAHPRCKDRVDANACGRLSAVTFDARDDAGKGDGAGRSQGLATSPPRVQLTWYCTCRKALAYVNAGVFMKVVIIAASHLAIQWATGVGRCPMDPQKHIPCQLPAGEARRAICAYRSTSFDGLYFLPSKLDASSDHDFPRLRTSKREVSQLIGKVYCTCTVPYPSPKTKSASATGPMHKPVELEGS